MGLPKGRTNNLKGRPKGSQNKTSQELRQIITDVFEYNLDTIQEDLESLTPKERLKFLTSLLPYIMPRQQFVLHENQDAPPIRIEFADGVDLNKLIGE